MRLFLCGLFFLLQMVSMHNLSKALLIDSPFYMSRQQSFSLTASFDTLQQALQDAENRALNDFKDNQAPRWLKRHESLPFACTSCGKCCQVEGQVYMSPGEISAASSLFNVAPTVFIQTYASHTISSKQGEVWIRLKETRGEENIPSCIFLKDKQCQIYESRPTQCKTYPFWPSFLASPTMWNAECRALDDWNPEDGGCEGMRPLDSIKNQDYEVPLDYALEQLYRYIQDERLFPSGPEISVEHPQGEPRI